MRALWTAVVSDPLCPSCDSALPPRYPQGVPRVRPVLVAAALCFHILRNCIGSGLPERLQTQGSFRCCHRLLKCDWREGGGGDVKCHCGFVWSKNHSWSCWAVGCCSNTDSSTLCSGSLGTKGVCVCVSDHEWAKSSCQGLAIETMQVGGWPCAWAVFGSNRHCLKFVWGVCACAPAKKAAASSVWEMPLYSPGALSGLEGGGPSSLLLFAAFVNVMVASSTLPLR